MSAVASLMIGFTLYGVQQGYPRQATLFPGIVSGLGVLFAVARLRELARSRRYDDVPPEPASPEPIVLPDGQPPSSARRSLVAFGWVFAVLPTIWLIGYPVGLALYVGAFLLGHRINGWRVLALAAGAGAFVQIVFGMVLEVRLPAGIIGGLFT